MIKLNELPYVYRDSNTDNAVLLKTLWRKEQQLNVIQEPHFLLTHSHTMTPFDTPGKQAF